jgi:hypothetical protein
VSGGFDFGSGTGQRMSHLLYEADRGTSVMSDMLRAKSSGPTTT